MTSETKEVFDTLMAVLGPAGLMGVGIGFFGWLKAKSEKPHIAPPQVGGGALAQIGGMVMGQQTAHDIIESLRAIATAYDRCSTVRELEMELQKKMAVEERDFRKEIAKEERDFRRRLAEDTHEQQRVLSDNMRNLSNRIEQFSCNP